MPIAPLLPLALVAVAITTNPHPTSIPNTTAALGLDQSVAYQTNALHDGAVSGSRLVPPLQLKWNVNLNAVVSYPLVVNSLIFVTAGQPPVPGTVLYALDSRTGQTVWSQPVGGTTASSSAAYDNGTIFVVTWEGNLRAFDAALGTPLWQLQLPGQIHFNSALTALGGIVYTGGSGRGGTVYAVDEATHTVLWTQSVENGAESSPSVTDDVLFVSYDCPQTYAIDRFTGAIKWHHIGPCEGGGGLTAVYHHGRVYVRDVYPNLDGDVFSSDDGSLLGKFNSWVAPAFEADRVYLVSFGRLNCQNVITRESQWGFAGDAEISSAPVIANGFVYVGSKGGNLYALDTASGALQWTTNIGVGIQPPNENGIQFPLTGLGVGSGVLVVPARNRLFVFGN
jgi:outer membrane protein assembly factor BamB